ncbi:hypothetical protein ICW40_13660 [Actinotalea ferrariae]|uniref:hypothetical protein n=1 Tax=Actinotalea ferrariae TaxID=1386098 RepID=UPI001C8CD169|nr:hypothetical protein [Actinotalea ferrariae]MBX9245850.1 hypothetical protein [Actinotalea ferrariae]
MDTIAWPAASALDAAAGSGWGGLWSVLFTAQRAVGALVQVTSFAEGLDLIWLGEELRAACDDVATRHFGAVAEAVAADLGPLPGLAHAAAGRAVVAGLLSAVICRADELLAEDLTGPDARWLAGMTSLLFAARVHLSVAGAR